MADVSKNKKKASISEEDTSLILQRYSATTILALLQEVVHSAGVKIDWNALVKRTSTGISNAREYQMLWRHLAYGDALIEKVEDDAEPLEDDSDLEIELEPSPAVNVEASTEAAACVKVLIASGSPSESGPTSRSVVEAPLTINIPNGQSLRNPSDNSQQTRSTLGTNITIPVSVQKQSLPSVPSSEGLDGNSSASANLPPRRKRKLWTEEEDMELIAAVQKCGEGNWANILKGDFKHDRTASQLSQRWAIIRKRKANLTTNSGGNLTGGALTEAQLAARQAVSMALNMPMKGSLSSTSIAAANNASTLGNSFTAPASITVGDASPSSAPSSEVGSKAPVTSSSPTLPLPQPSTSQTTIPRGTGISNQALAKSRPTPKRSSIPVKSPPPVPNPLIQAAAVAAGARIANPSTAASLFKAAQSRNAVHIRQGGSVPQSSMPGAKQLGSSAMGTLPPNVHYFRTGLAPHHPTYSGVIPGGPRPGGSSGRLALVGQPPLAVPTTSSNQQVAPESKSVVPTNGNVDSRKSTTNSTVPDAVSTAAEVEFTDEKKVDGMGEAQESDQDHVPDLKAGGSHTSANVGENESVGRPTEAASSGLCENPGTADKLTDPINSNGENHEVVGSGMVENHAVDETKDCSLNEVCEDQNEKCRASDAQNANENQEILPVADGEKNLCTGNASQENDNVLENRVCFPITWIGDIQTVDNSPEIQKQSCSSNKESS